MHNIFDWVDGRRMGPRVGASALCSEHVGGRERHGLLLDFSSTGLRIERPFHGGATPREMTLELEVPEVDEVIWAKGEVCFDKLTPSYAPGAGPFGLVRTTGVRIVKAAARDLRILRDVSYEIWRLRERDVERAGELALASCYARG